jgi:flagellar basal-body rod protein FlgF
VPGFKKQELSFAAVEAGLRTAHSPGAQAALLRAQTATNFQPGQMRFTGVNTDVAIDGAGFFEVQLPDGTAFSRDGEFQINAQGQLVTKQGFPVLGESGLLQLDRTNAASLSISATGEVSQGTDVIGTLKLVEFGQPQFLRQISGGCFLADNPEAKPADVATPSLRQGFLESANTSSTLEMANLIRVMRSFEASQRLIQIEDERMGRAIAELGSPT